MRDKGAAPFFAALGSVIACDRLWSTGGRFSRVSLGLGLSGRGIFMARADTRGGGLVGFPFLFSPVLFAVWRARGGVRRSGGGPRRGSRRPFAVCGVSHTYSGGGDASLRASPGCRRWSRRRPPRHWRRPSRPGGGGGAGGWGGGPCQGPGWGWARGGAGAFFRGRGFEGGTSSRIRPSHPILDSTSALRHRWSPPPRSRPSA